MSTAPTVLTGITTTGIPHLGNYAGAIQPAIAASQQTNARNYFFLADWHGLVKCQQPERLQQSTQAIAATWLAAGLDPQKVVFYRQSDVPEIAELAWLLTCVTAKGLMNRSHAYKAAVDANLQDNADEDRGITMGLFSYPVLMAADILLFNASHVPVGRDQTQHIEMARDIAGRFNHIYGPHFQLPQAVIAQQTALLPGLDGRKMSKSYDNTIPVFAPSKKLRKLIMRIQTDSTPREAPKDPDQSHLFQLYAAFANPEQIADLRQQYQTGIGWGDVKLMLFELLEQQLADKRQHYDELMANPRYIEQILQQGAEQARTVSQPFIATLRQAVGIRPLG